MAFGAISTLYLPTAANAGSSLWGSDVRQLLSVADAATDNTTQTNHGTGGAVTRTYAPYTTTSADLTQADYGWGITPTDMGSVTGAYRFYPAGNHTATIRITTSYILQTTGTLTMYIYRVSAAPGRTRTLLGNSSASVIFPAASGAVNATVTVALAEVVFGVDETIQYSFEVNTAGQTTPAVVTRLLTGTNAAIESRINTPILKTLADTTGTATATSTTSGTTGKVLGTSGSSSGAGVVSGVMSSRAETTGSASGVATASGQASSVSGTTGSSAGVASASGAAGKILGTIGTVGIGGGGGTTVIIKKIFNILDD